MCGGGGGPDYAAQERAAEAERKAAEAQRELEKQQEAEKVMKEKRSQAEKDAAARARQQSLLARGVVGDPEEDPLKPSTRGSLLNKNLE